MFSPSNSFDNLRAELESSQSHISRMVSVIPTVYNKKLKLSELTSNPSQKKKTHLLISDCLRLCLADTLTGEDINVKEVPIIKILENKGAHRRPKAA